MIMIIITITLLTCRPFIISSFITETNWGHPLYLKIFLNTIKFNIKIPVIYCKILLTTKSKINKKSHPVFLEHLPLIYA